MKEPDVPENEESRLKALKSYQILDTLPEKDFDDITKLASEICKTPISLVSLIDADRQWFKSHYGLDASETPREVAFCAHAINKPNEILIVPDSREDDRFADNPLVTDSPYVIFYAGVPLVDAEGFALGTLCIIDQHPKELSSSQLESLKSLANQIVKLMELRKKNIELLKIKETLEYKNKELEQFAYVVSHDIKSPLANIIALSDLIEKEFILNNQELTEYLNMLTLSAYKLKDFVDGLLEYYRSEQIRLQYSAPIKLHSFLQSIIPMIGNLQSCKLNYPEENPEIEINKIALEQVLINLISNSAKYNDKEEAVIDLHFKEDAENYYFEVCDNGIGIPEKYQSQVFDLFKTFGQKDKYGNLGTGIGLATVNKLVRKMGGVITVESVLGKGTIFRFNIKKPL